MVFSVHFQGKPFSITVNQVYAPTSNAKEAEVEQFYEDLQDLSELTPKKESTHGHHQMVNTEVRLIIFFAAKNGEALYNQQKQDRELTVAQIMNSLLPNSDLNRRKWGKPLDRSGMT